MRKGVQVQSDKGFRYAIKCRVCSARWVDDVPVEKLVDVFRGKRSMLGSRARAFCSAIRAHDCADMAEAKRNAGRYDYRLIVFEVTEVMWNADPKGYHPCGPKCESAKGATCHCECRGQKHGIANMPKDPVTPEAYGHTEEREVEEIFRQIGPEGRSDQWATAHDRKSRRVGKNGI